ncbi:MAG: Tim44 domain-containing protein [Betaproteobacteria bacterium]|nr:Tim44 domain-containing protein [Betaproteobacteria bacterium]
MEEGVNKYKFYVILAVLLSFGVATFDAEARRLGGGRSIGKQREAIRQQAAPRAPAQQQAAPAQSAPQPQSGPSRWLGPLAGLALGAGLAALFLNNGIAGLLAALLVIGVIVAAAVFAVRALRSRTAAEPMQYAGAGARPVPTGRMPLYGAGGEPLAEPASRFPAGFDAEQFMRHARLNFVRLQAAHDQKDLSTMRDFMTPELYGEIEAQVRESGDRTDKTDVVTLNAEVLDVAAEGDSYVVSVRFSGMIRERADRPPEPFSEIWHLEKPVNGRSGWLIAGIQQS